MKQRSENTSIETLAFKTLDKVLAKYLGTDVSLEAKRKAELVAALVEREIKKSLQKHPDRLKELLLKIDKDNKGKTSNHKARIFIDALIENHFEPVITAHPTDPRSEDAIDSLLSISSILYRATHKKDARDNDKFVSELSSQIQSLMDKPLIPQQKMTPEDENVRFTKYWMQIVKSYPHIRQKIVKDIRLILYPDSEIPESIMRAIEDAIKKQLRVRSWVASDRDGNKNITGDSMDMAVKGRQIAFLRDVIITNCDLLDEKLLGSKENLVILNNLFDDWLVRLNEISDEGTLYTKEASDAARHFVHQQLRKILNSEELKDDVVRKRLERLNDVIDLMGYTGIPKSDIREDIAVYSRVINEIFGHLKTHASQDRSSNSEINAMQTLLSEKVSYKDLSEEDKKKFLTLLGADALWFDMIAKNRDHFSDEAKRCFGCMEAQFRHPTTFSRDIMSEAKSEINFLELTSLHSLIRHFNGVAVNSDNYGMPHGQVLFLYETAADLRKSPTILKRLLEYPSYRKMLIQQGYFQSLKGPSDTTARGGLFAMLEILHSMNEEEEVLRAAQVKYPELQTVKIRFFHGSGGDWKRQLTASSALHQTVQGQAAFDKLVGHGAMKRTIIGVAGQESEIELLAQEVTRLAKTNQRAYSALREVTLTSIYNYSRFINNTGIVSLYSRILGKAGYAIIDACNTSSRAGAKRSTGDENIFGFRAISQVTAGLLIGINTEITNSIADITKLEEIRHLLPDLYDLAIVKNIVFKVMFAAATSNFPRAWQIINGGLVPNQKEIDALISESAAMSVDAVNASPKHMLAHVQRQAEENISSIVAFLPNEIQAPMRRYIEANKNSGITVDQLAIGALEPSRDVTLQTLASDAIRHRGTHLIPAWRAMDNYAQNPNDKNLELAVGWIRATDATKPFPTLEEIRATRYDSGKVAGSSRLVSAL